MSRPTEVAYGEKTVKLQSKLFTESIARDKARLFSSTCKLRAGP
jgi:hypothetical protein